MKALLAIDTSSTSTGVALCVDGKVVGASTVVKAYRHSENLFARIDLVLEEAGLTRDRLTCVAVTRGPGSFTGLRVGIATAKGLAYGLGVPVAGVSSLLALAHPHMGFDGIVAPAVDARKSQVYACAFDGDGVEIMPERALDPARFAKELAETGRPCLVVGSGTEAYREAFDIALGGNLQIAPESSREIDPASVALLGYGEYLAGRAVAAAALTASYLRRSEAEEKAFPA